MSKAGSRKPNRQRHKRNIRQAKPGEVSIAVAKPLKLYANEAVKKQTKPKRVRKRKKEEVMPIKLSSVIQHTDTHRTKASDNNKANTWTQVVEQYVNGYNQAETEQHARVLSDLVADHIHNERILKRFERLRERDLLRGAIPAGSETTAKLIRVNESTSEVSVLLRLHVTRRMEQSGRYYKEQRYEMERLWLSQSKSQWSIVKVEPVISERRPRYGTSSSQWPVETDSEASQGVPQSPSMPYLNYDLIRSFKHHAIPNQYRRDLVAAYADRWWNEGNPAYELFEVNCTNYVSQCIFAGNAPMNYTGTRGSGWWYKGRDKGQEWWSYSWAVSHALANHLSTAHKSGLRAEVVQSADQLELGDVIAYDWNGDNRFQHSTIVTAFDAAGQPLVNANTVASRHRYWDYQDSYAWTPQTRYRFFHLSAIM